MTTLQEFSADTEPAGQDLILRPRGELDLATAPALRRRLRAAIDELTGDRLILDLAELTFLDASGLRVLVWAHNELAGQGRRLTLVAARPNVRKVLKIARLDTALNLRDTLEDARSGPRAGAAGKPTAAS